MAEASVSVSQDQFSCPICLDLLKDPVTILCGHSFCMDCITGCWNQEDQKGVYSCPQCRQTFTPRPTIGKNTILSEMVEKLKNIVIQSDSSLPLYARPGDVECDVCIGRKRKAVKSCLVCLSSYCETHLRVHNDLNPGKKHKVIDPTGKLEDLICSHHDKLLEVFCRTDQTCICVLCAMDEHNGHKTVSAAAERTEKQKQLEESQRKAHQTIQERQKHLQEMKGAIKSLKSSAQEAVQDCEKIFSEMIRSIERRRSELTKLIRDQERTEVSQAEALIEKLEWEIGELRKREAELEQLSRTEDPASFLQSFQRQCSLANVEDTSTDILFSHMSFEKIKENVSQLRDKLKDFLKEGVFSISDKVKKISMLVPREPLTRGDFLRYIRQLTLDPSTAHLRLHLAGGNKEVACNDMLSLPDNPDRFNYWQQVLCKETLTERCYWEVEWTCPESIIFGVSVAVSYNEISRKESDKKGWFGYNKQSWCLTCCSSGCSVIHEGKETKLSVIPSTKIGVYVDHNAGVLSFYSISSDTMTPLYKVVTTFTQPLYAGFWLYTGSNVKLCY